MSKERIQNEIDIVVRLLDNFDLFRKGLCLLNRDITRERLLGDIRTEIRIPAQTMDWIAEATVANNDYFEIQDSYTIIGYNWKCKDPEPRWYWLKSKLNELKNKLKECE